VQVLVVILSEVMCVVMVEAAVEQSGEAGMMTKTAMVMVQLVVMVVQLVVVEVVIHCSPMNHSSMRLQHLGL
jgi:hypothetical protein